MRADLLLNAHSGNSCSSVRIRRCVPQRIHKRMYELSYPLQLEALTPKEAPNPHRPRGPTQKLYLDREVSITSYLLVPASWLPLTSLLLYALLRAPQTTLVASWLQQALYLLSLLIPPLPYWSPLLRYSACCLSLLWSSRHISHDLGRSSGVTSSQL